MEWEEPNRLQFEFLIPEKVGPHPEILGQPNQQDTNRHNHTILVITALGFEETPVTSFKVSNQLTC